MVGEPKLSALVTGDGAAFAAVGFIGKRCDQPCLAAVASALSIAVGHDDARRGTLDRQVLVPTLFEFGRNAEEAFRQTLLGLFPEAQILAKPDDLPHFARELTLVSVAPVKKKERMQVRRTAPQARVPPSL